MKQWLEGYEGTSGFLQSFCGIVCSEPWSYWARVDLRSSLCTYAIWADAVFCVRTQPGRYQKVFTTRRGRLLQDSVELAQAAAAACRSTTRIP
jgi:hypothetical protein